jgi:hypothetical protein
MAAQTRSGTAADEEIELFYGDCGQTRRDTAPCAGTIAVAVTGRRDPDSPCIRRCPPDLAPTPFAPQFAAA